MMSPNKRSQGGSRASSQSSPADSSIILMFAVALVSFFAGTVFTAHMNMECGTGADHHFMDAKIEELAQRRVSDLQAMAFTMTESKETAKEEPKPAPSSSSLVKFPTTTQNFAQAMARVTKLDFFEQMDLGVPMDVPTEKDSDVLILYNKPTAMPESLKAAYNDPSTITDDSSSFMLLQTEEALKKCEYVHVILADHSMRKNQCTAIVPNYESHHLQKWMRLGEKGLDKKADLSLVSRGIMPNGNNQFKPPRRKYRDDNWEMLKKYFGAFDDTIAELKPLVEKVATPKKTVTVMVVNFGQSELLMNFVCAAKSRNLDISSVIVFVTDLETKVLAEGLGLVAFYDERNYGDIPSEAAHQYGDKKFTAMMMAKVMCVQMVNSLGYNILFQDVDIVWYKNPIPYFESESSKNQNFDMMFQDDGGHSVRYAPYSANSGFYYVRHNPRTEHFFSALLTSGDVILETKSHQQALIALMSEHVSLYGLKVKVFSRETEEFPGGYHYHQPTQKYMREFFDGKVDPYIFHMSWTFNKDNKLLFLQQLGEWYVDDQCLHKKPEEITLGDGNFASGCCLKEANFACHFRDKPSIFPCFDSPPIDKDKPSFWKAEEWNGNERVHVAVAEES